MVIPSGIVGVGLFMAVVLLGLVLTDIYLEVGGSQTIGRRLADFSARYPAYAGAVAALLGALLGHFFW